jgi:UDP-3-O-[3-hydroxymyristoyl] glucosamine N-acyltransferase
VRFAKTHTLSEIASLLGCDYLGESTLVLSGLNEIHKVNTGDIAFVDHPKYFQSALGSLATAVIINERVVCPEGKGLLISTDPFRDFNKLITHFQSATIAPRIAPHCRIHPSVTLGNNVSIGEGTIIFPGVVIDDNVHIGAHCVVQANTVLGSHAFYYKNRPEGRDRLLTCGELVIEDYVEIGANCTIDRGVTGDTRIGAHTKIDNLVHIGHDTRVGMHCLMAAQVGVAGCVVLDDGVILWGQVGVASNVHIGKGAVVLGKAGVTKSIEGNKTYFGNPIEEARLRFRELAALRQLPTTIEQLRQQMKC